MKPYHHESVHLTAQPTESGLVETDRLLVTPLLNTGENIFQVQVASPNSLAALTALKLQILTEGIVWDQELLAECRCGEI